jgi:uncharacterized paraquat-inducible protein A
MKSIKILLMAALSIISINTFSQEKAGRPKDTTKHTQLYACPMHAEVTAKKPGTCPKCGMNLQLSAKEQMKMDVTKNYVCPTHLEQASDKPGKCSKCGMSLTMSSKEKMKMDVANNYTCPMHPEVKSDKPGKCPNCNMTMTEVKKKEKS